jgi:hypothetical protein
MHADTIIFLAIAVPIGLLWIAFLIRYVQANRRWFTRLVEAESASSDHDQSFAARALKRFPQRPRGLYYFAYAVLTAFSSGPLLILREHRDANVETARREAVARFTPLMMLCAVLVAAWALIAVCVLVFLGVHALVEA